MLLLETFFIGMLILSKLPENPELLSSGMNGYP